MIKSNFSKIWRSKLFISQFQSEEIQLELLNQWMNDKDQYQNLEQYLIIKFVAYFNVMIIYCSVKITPFINKLFPTISKISNQFFEIYLGDSNKYFKDYHQKKSIRTHMNDLWRKCSLLLFSYRRLTKLQYFYIQKNMIKYAIIFLGLTILQAQYTLNLNSPFLLDNKYANISTLNYDNQFGFYVGFKDKQFRHYSSSFSSYSNYTFPYIIDFASTWSFKLNNIALSNGTNWSSNSIITGALIDNYQTFKVYNFTTMEQISSYSFNERIILHWGFPFQLATKFIPHHVLICNETVKIIHNGVIYKALNFSQVYQPGVICDQAIFYWWYQNGGLDYYSFKHIFFVSLSSKQVLNLTVYLKFTMNYTTSTFDLSYNISRFTIFSSPERINKLLITNALLLMQSNSTGTMHLYSIAALSMRIVDAAIPKHQVFSFFNKFNNFYLLQSYGLILLEYSTITKTISYISTVSTLPYNTYRLKFGSQLDILYIPNTPYIYKAGKCMDQTLLDANNSCQQYICQTANCFSCTLTQAICSVCNPGFTRSELYQCMYSNNTTQQQNPNNFSSFSNKKLPNECYSNFFLNLQWIFDLMNFLVKLLKTIISFPAARRLVTPLFYYFGNFDDLFLYSYHNREYGDTMSSTFQQISAIENQKWKLFSLDQLNNDMGINMSKIQSFFEFQREYLPKKGLYQQGFFKNCSNFLFIEVPIVLLAFITMKIIFKAISRFSISQILRRFDFWIYFAIIIFDGNVQQFSFYLTTELKTVFAFECGNKYVKVIIFFIGYCLFIFSVCGYIIGLSFYKRLNRYFTENNKNILSGNWILILQNGIRNMMLGVAHSLFRNGQYSVLLSSLLIIEGIFFIIFLLGISFRIYIKDKIIWIYILFTFLRILLISTFCLDLASINYIIFQQVQRILIFQMIALYLISIIVLLCQTCVQSIRMLIKICKVKKQLPPQKDPKISKDLFNLYQNTIVIDPNNNQQLSQQSGKEKMKFEKTIIIIPRSGNMK